MSIRTYKTGDELAQVGIYNESAADLPKFKPATVDEARRRLRAADFDPAARFYAVEGDVPVGYITFQANGRMSRPWCRKGKEQHAEPLFDAALAAMKERRIPLAWAAYRDDWQTTREFFLARGFAQTREMLNFIVDLIELPTPAARIATAITPLQPEDIAPLRQAAADLLRAPLQDIEKSWFRNQWFPPESFFCLRHRTENRPIAVGLLVRNASFAHPKQVDASMPCFRLGALGTEGLTTKRIHGLFSFFVTDPRETSALGLDLVGHAARLMQDVDGETIAAQVSSDVPHLVRFYRQNFRPQGSFPIYERAL